VTLVQKLHYSSDHICDITTKVTLFIRSHMWH